MKNDKIIPGTILISLGIIFLLHSFGVIHIRFWNVVSLWPIFLVIAGINLMFANNRTPLATGLKIGVVILGLLTLVFARFDNRSHSLSRFPHFSYRVGDHNNKGDDNDDDFDLNFDDNDKGIDAVKINGASQFSTPFTPNTHVAKLNISGGGTVYRLSDTTGKLFEAFTQRHLANYMLSSSSPNDSVQILNFKLSNGKEGFNLAKKNEAIIFKLNSAPIWDMDIQTGATEMNFDLSKFKIRNVDLNGGMAGFNLKLGEPLESTKVDVQTGMAGVHIAIPKDAACSIKTDSGLSSKDFYGFTKINDDHYETPGFAAAKNKIYIKFDGAISGFTVTRY